MKSIALAAAGLAATIAGAQAAPSVERGEYIVTSIGACGSCHTPIGPQGFDETKALSGRLVEDVEAFTAIAPNITPASRISGWSDAELARAIREGIRPDGSLIGPPMPFEVYKGISDDDLASIVQYLRTVPAVENDPGTSTYRMPLPPAYGPPITSVASIPEGVTAEYGEYLAGPLGHCIVCHTPMENGIAQFETSLGAGGNEFHGPWGISVSPNITPTGLADYSDEDIAKMITAGVRPDGNPMMPPMAYAYYAKMKPEDVQAIVVYLRSLEPKD
ncbi:Cytochrome c, mono-and diheme variants [Devosia enhydra]|uniref:Cytochrome c, mono-and diheme variants n=1 Tax=Devosia enhydra TaxID=665118 RepID=A0A1K2HVV3_9HYPH|nr:cytochrome c [Devosia enhydra]SFZ82974.1 Cytochrome c, mono-and diheme variants [Devosia enhydra]